MYIHVESNKLQDIRPSISQSPCSYLAWVLILVLIIVASSRRRVGAVDRRMQEGMRDVMHGDAQRRRF